MISSTSILGAAKKKAAAALKASTASIQDEQKKWASFWGERLALKTPVGGDGG
ncbi:hypothetical protein [Pseudomonas sp. S1(2024)]|uniref:hypothetical protein n=1 Tax=Pseudomonas sp. S1(2024) TaxID=3390191 RepID=UPI0039785D31